RARDDLRKKVAAHVRDGQPDQAGAPARQRPRVAVTDVAQLADMAQHRLACGGRHVGPPVEHARDRGDGYPRQGGDIPDCRARAPHPHAGFRDARSCRHSAGPPLAMTVVSVGPSLAVTDTGYYRTINVATRYVKAG